MTQVTEYLYAADTVAQPNRALIILPEIYGVQRFTTDLAERVAKETGWTSYVLDHFYAVTGRSEAIDYDNSARGIEIMQQMTGEKYLELLKKAINEVQQRQPELKRIAIWGFCFGGKLTWLSGVIPEVTDLISFYGGASLAPDFWEDKSTFEALLSAHEADEKLRIFAAYGEHDPMIPASDRQTVEAGLKAAKLDYQIHTYDAGHAFFNVDRDTYVEPAAQQAWQDVSAWLAK